MEIVKVFNNNVVLAREGDGGEAVLTGRGLGFQARPGDAVDQARVARIFRPVDGRDPDHLAQMLAGIPPELLAMVGAALVEVGLGAKAAGSPMLVIAVADHVNFAQRRLAMGWTVEYPLLAEVKHLYAEEYDQAARLLGALNAGLPTALPPGEAVALALHLVNAGFSAGDLTYTYTMTGVIRQMVAVIESAYGISLPPDSVSLGRFITHVRYVFVRIHQHRQLDDEHSPIGTAIRAAYPEALECAQRMATVVALRLGTSLTDDEVSYLALHVARVANDVG